MASCGDWTEGATGCTKSCDTKQACLQDDTLDCPAGRNCRVECTAEEACLGETEINCAPGQTCEVECAGKGACQSATVNCPPDAPCHVTCDGRESCFNMVVNCPDEAYECTMDCSAGDTLDDGEDQACFGVAFNCNGSVCTMNCSDTPQVCFAANINCGENQCEAYCEGPLEDGPELNVNNACALLRC